MYDTVVLMLLLFPWSVIALMLLGGLRQRLRKATVRSR
jgi:hypothetical protein